MKKSCFLEIIFYILILLLMVFSLFSITKKFYDFKLRKEATDLFYESMNVVGYATTEIKLFQATEKYFPESIKDISENNFLERYDVELKNKDNKYELILNKDISEEVREYYCDFIETEIYSIRDYFLLSCIPLRVEIIKEI